MNSVLVNFSAGETSPRSRGRFDLAWFKSSCEKIFNFLVEVTGLARYRCGFRYVRTTRHGDPARLIPFQLNNSIGYMLEFTQTTMRAYILQSDGVTYDLITTQPTTVTGITKANPAVLTVVSTATLTNGQEIILKGLVGMPELENRQVKLAGPTGLTFQLLDPVTGANIDSTAFGTYTSGGVVHRVTEIATPYTLNDLDDIQFAQNETQMYLTHPVYPPQKLKVSTPHVFTLAAYARTSDPFGVAGPTLTFTGLAEIQTVIIPAFAAGTVISETTIYDLSTFVGAVELNGTMCRIIHYSGPPPGWVGPWNPSYVLSTTAGIPIDPSTVSAYVSGGIAVPHVENPLTVAFYEGRLCFFGTNQRPNTIFLSRAPSPTTGDTRYDDFTGGTLATDACFFALAPVSGSVDYAAWVRGTVEHLIVGTFGGPFRISGSGLDESISPSSINVRQIDTFGCEAAMSAGGARIFYIQRGGVAIRTVRYSANTDGLESYDMLLNAEQIAYSRLKRTVLQTGRPDILWTIREDGILAGMTVQGSENIAGWHRQKIGGVRPLVLDIQVSARSDRDDQLWAVSERVIGGIARRFVEILTDAPVFPDRADFYTAADNEDSDFETFKNVLYRRQEEYTHMDAVGTYNGSARGVTAGATLTPAAVSGASVVFAASTAVFLASDVGKQIWRKPDRNTGIGTGRATILSITSTTATCSIDSDVPFNSTSAIPAGDWYITATTIYGLAHLEGERVAVLVDGAVYSDGRTTEFPTVTVASGKITLTDPAAVVHVGLPYEGFIKTHNLELGGQLGPTQDKPRNIVEMFIRFLNTLGVDYGTDVYNMKKIEFRRPGVDTMDRPAPVFSGIMQVHNPDDYEAAREKHVVISQRLPLPCVVQFVDLRYDTTEDA